MNAMLAIGDSPNNSQNRETMNRTTHPTNKTIGVPNILQNKNKNLNQFNQKPITYLNMFLLLF